MARIDDSHQPFKRKRSLGPGPRRRPRIHEAKSWKCQKGPKTKKFYVQVCTWIGGGKPKAKRKVKLKKAWKRTYNKVYRAWARRTGVTAAKGAVRTYRCRKTPGTSCR